MGRDHTYIRCICPPEGACPGRADIRFTQRRSSRICNGYNVNPEGALSPKKGLGDPEGPDDIFHPSMIKLGLLCATFYCPGSFHGLLRRYLPAPKDLTEL